MRTALLNAVWLIVGPHALGQITTGHSAFIDLGTSSASRAHTLAVDPAGNIFVASNVVEPSGRPQIRVTKTDPKGNTVATLDFGGSGLDIPTGALVDPQGNLVLVGTSSSADFPVVSPVVVSTNAITGFIVRLDAQLTHIVSSSRIGGTKAGGGDTAGMTGASSVAIDNRGNVYITGSTTTSDFPVTRGAFQTLPLAGDGFGTPSYAFIIQITPSGNIGYSTYFGGNNTRCMGGTSCAGVFGNTSGTSIAVNPAGSVVLAGNTNAIDLPITVGTLGQQCSCSNTVHVGFIAKLTFDGSQLVMGSYIPNPQLGVPGQSDISIQSLILDQSDNIIIGGSAPIGFVVTPNVVAALFPGGNPPPSNAPYAGFVSKINPTGTRYVFSTYFGGNVTTSALYAGVNGVTSLTLGPQGSIIVTGGSVPSELPVPAGTPLLGETYVATLSSDATKVESLFTAPAGSAGGSVAITGQNNVVVLGSTGSLLIYPMGYMPAFVGVVGAAAYQTSGQVAPFELISLYGNGIGPSSPVSGKVVDGILTTLLGDTEVLFDGIPAPLLYAGPNQINAVVPGSIAGKIRTIIQISNLNGVIVGPTLSSALSQPQVFTNPKTYSAAALNQDGTPNSFENPARNGTIVTVWATGVGMLSMVRPDGIITNAPLARPTLPIAVFQSADSWLDSLEVLYAGDAPGFVQGTTQVNFRLPSQIQSGSVAAYFALQTGTSISTMFTVFLTP